MNSIVNVALDFVWNTINTAYTHICSLSKSISDFAKCFFRRQNLYKKESKQEIKPVITPILNKKDEKMKELANEKQITTTPPSTKVPPSTEDLMKGITPMIHTFTETHSIEEQQRLHEEAKTYSIESLAYFDTEIKFMNPPKEKAYDVTKVTIDSTFLNKNIFKTEYTWGVLNDITFDGEHNKEEIEIVYTLASQNNGAECTAVGIHPLGKAVIEYGWDMTQGPQGQLGNRDVIVEIINAMAHKGFNAMVYVLDNLTKRAITFGYFMPSNTIADRLIEQLNNLGHKIEYPVIISAPIIKPASYDSSNCQTRPIKQEIGQKKIHYALVSGCASYYANETLKILQEPPLEDQKRDQLEFLCALNVYRAQFNYCLKLAQESKKPVICKTVAIGLGIFENQPENIAKAFYIAATEFQQAVNSMPKLPRIQIRLQVFIYYDYKDELVYDKNAARLGEMLGLERDPLSVMGNQNTQKVTKFI